MLFEYISLDDKSCFTRGYLYEAYLEGEYYIFPKNDLGYEHHFHIESFFIFFKLNNGEIDGWKI